MRQGRRNEGTEWKGEWGRLMGRNRGEEYGEGKKQTEQTFGIRGVHTPKNHEAPFPQFNPFLPLLFPSPPSISLSLPSPLFPSLKKGFEV